MQKLIRGIIDFRKNILPDRREQFAQLAQGQAPDVLFITCSDSRVAPNWFASTNPGELFVVRNVGNLVPPCDHPSAEFDHSVAAAIEFSTINLSVTDIVVCGHSGCGAIHALATGVEKVASPHLKLWLSQTDRALKEAQKQIQFGPGILGEDQLSQMSVLHQIDHLMTYPHIAERVKAGKLRLHAWWFSIAQGSVYFFDEKTRRFTLIDDTVGESLIMKLQTLQRGPAGGNQPSIGLS